MMTFLILDVHGLGKRIRFVLNVQAYLYAVYIMFRCSTEINLYEL